MPKRQIVRLVAVGLMTVSGGIFAVNAGLIPGFGNGGSTPPSTPDAVTNAVTETAEPDQDQAEPPITAAALAPAPTLPAPITEASETIPAAVTDPAPTDAQDLPETPDFTLTQPDLAQPGNLSDRMAATPDLNMAAPDDNEVSQFGLPCGLSVSATAAPAAMVALDIMNPCQPNARVVIEHSGLTLTEQTDAMGLLAADIPAFETPAFFTIRVEGSSETALAVVPDLAEFDRVAVAWEDTRDLELHAMEFGADYGETGHIWQENAGTPARAQAGEGGFVTQLGNDAVDAPLMAQVYTFPRDTLTRQGAVRLSIEAPINTRNCGQDTMARTLQTDLDGAVAVTELTFTLPACDAMGDYLVLQNLLQDLRVASN
ncbi:hypothetical protein GTA62_08950 [Roseobacter sp. HKCCD9010]|uniref:hypothetical protein n=1 Tax=unclassified Roseobacter TaxID=196798 RepID=UPI0014923EDE|nr:MULTISPECIES: hypothetical protein [unclassified Roseobacter]MBF9051166.1 hypothetical protein [Rhodobacterales bacterium HKCCD4356]NNV12935.1 hypothetical protein [Roseobacter sp. HKCCD7357]NNV16880.1 hypothetical protein [Roseobacter sp. HKCCD8768]NNV26488.1 hypothetical protein [Roseobacter sp. HKCCD8192]NNV30601.1 hypothetical protein [Roseobacter sp. HKCCD9061]